MGSLFKVLGVSEQNLATLPGLSDEKESDGAS
jgi:hypothetical protein